MDDQVQTLPDQSPSEAAPPPAEPAPPGDVELPDDGSPSRFPRRRFLVAGAGLGAAALAGLGFGISEWVGGSTAAPTETADFRSRPDLQPALPSVAVPAGGTAPGYIFLTPATGPGQFGPMIVDNAGQLVWFRQVVPASLSHVATNFQVQQYRGQPVLTWWEGTVVLPQGYGEGEYVIADTSYREITRVRAAGGLHGDLHEFVLTPEGTALLTAYRPATTDLTSIAGPSHGTVLDSFVQEVDVRTGRVAFQWDARDHVPLDESYVPASTIPTEGGDYDFFHANSVDVDTDGNLIVSARNTWTVYKIDRTSGAILWRLNGKRSDFAMGEGAGFQYQHDARRSPSGTLTVFDDGAGPNVALRSRGIALSLDDATRRATLAHEYLPDPSVLAVSQGSIQTTSNGNIFVGWGSESYATEYSPDGRLLFDLALAQGSISYRAFRFDWTGHPEGRPALAAERAGTGRMTVYSSWNGATEVASWRVLGGPSSGALVPVGKAPRRGFETPVTVPYRPAVAVEALDGHGRVLGRSGVISV